MEREGHVDDPFTRRKTVPTLSTNKKPEEEDEDEDIEMTTERLHALEQKRIMKIEKEKQEKAEQMENIRRKMEDEDALSKKEKKKMAAASSKSSNQDIFNAHDFDIDINVSEMAVS